MDVYPGEIVAITGSNGAGKTTLCRLIAGTLKESSGIIRFNDKVSKSKERIRQSFLVGQDADYQIYSSTVEAEILLGLKKTPELHQQAEHYLEELKLTDYRKRHPASLSGGQKQRVLIAAAALRENSLLILDEPTSGLDGHHMKKTAKLLQNLAQQGRTIILITHDIELIKLCVTRIFHIEEGKNAYVCGLSKEKNK